MKHALVGVVVLAMVVYCGFLHIEVGRLSVAVDLAYERVEEQQRELATAREDAKVAVDDVVRQVERVGFWQGVYSDQVTSVRKEIDAMENLWPRLIRAEKYALEGIDMAESVRQSLNEQDVVTQRLGLDVGSLRGQMASMDVRVGYVENDIVELNGWRIFAGTELSAISSELRSRGILP